MTRKKIVTEFAAHSNEMLVQAWMRIDKCRVKNGLSKGCVTLIAAKRGDRIIAEATRRGVTLPCE